MSKPVLEVLIAKPTEAYRKDPTLAHPIFEIVGAAEGNLGIYYGTAIEDPDMLLLLIPWRSLAEHQALIDDKARYGAMGAHFAVCADTPTMDLVHVVLDAPLAPLLHAPYVSFVHETAPAPGHTLAELRAQTAAVARAADVPGCTGGGWGQALEREEFVLLHGWEDPKFHAEAAKLEHIKAAVKPWFEVGGIPKVVHVPLTEYKKYEA